jgi:hypothetical protein
VKQQLQPFDPDEVWSASERSAAGTATPAQLSARPNRAAAPQGAPQVAVVQPTSIRPSTAPAAQEGIRPPSPGDPPPPTPWKKAVEVAGGRTDVEQESTKPKDNKAAGRLDAAALQRIGAKLVAAAPDVDIRFTFETVSNKRPSVDRTQRGEIIVSTGLLAAVASEDELAGILALQMGEAIAVARRRATQATPVSASLPSAGPADAARNIAMADKIARQAPAADVDFVAKKILRDGGFDNEFAVVARSRMEAWDAAAPPIEKLKKTILGN